ncbi:MAG: YraN family protein [Candidatus Omnitrophota bacterium]|nr:YraN family protein [Candidatus Omnitrophota bacterium]
MENGSFYEKKATVFLVLNGYRILERNFRSRFGEIDIIARDGKYISFIEVKARNKSYLVSGKESVDKKKMEKIKKTALFYASKKTNSFFRFDVLEIIQGNLWRQYNLIKGAFDYTTDEHRRNHR